MPTKPRAYKPAHSQQAKKVYEQQRGSACKRGYGRAWQKYRLWFLRQHPLCSEPGCNKAAEHVDHKEPVSGPDDPLFFEPTNHQSLCAGHHSAKTIRDMKAGKCKPIR